MVLGNGSILLDFQLGQGGAEHLFSYLFCSPILSAWRAKIVFALIY